MANWKVQNDTYEANHQKLVDTWEHYSENAMRSYKWNWDYVIWYDLRRTGESYLVPSTQTLIKRGLKCGQFKSLREIGLNDDYTIMPEAFKRMCDKHGDPYWTWKTPEEQEAEKQSERESENKFIQKQIDDRKKISAIGSNKTEKPK